jgi:1,4-dihydroxy-2-naphthoyl-CoA hydrolase
MTDSDELTTLLHSTMPLCAHLNVEATEFTADAVVLQLAWADELCTSNGLLHGGTIMALADSAGGANAFLNLPDDASGTATIESKTNFLGGVTAGIVIATSTPLHVGSTTIVVETEISNNGRLVAKVTQTQAILRKQPALSSPSS